MTSRVQVGNHPCAEHTYNLTLSSKLHNNPLPNHFAWNNFLEKCVGSYKVTKRTIQCISPNQWSPFRAFSTLKLLWEKVAIYIWISAWFSELSLIILNTSTWTTMLYIISDIHGQMKKRYNLVFSNASANGLAASAAMTSSNTVINNFGSSVYELSLKDYCFDWPRVTSTVQVMGLNGQLQRRP